MNEKQNKIIEAYHEIYSCLHEIPLASDQKEFLTRFDKFQESVRSLRKLECRGVEQHEFNLGLTDKEYRALKLELIYRFCR